MFPNPISYLKRLLQTLLDRCLGIAFESSQTMLLQTAWDQPNVFDTVHVSFCHNWVKFFSKHELGTEKPEKNMYNYYNITGSLL